MNISIRQATEQDVELLQELNQEVFVDNYKYDEDLVMDWALSKKGKKYFTDVVSSTESICFIAEIDGKAVGYVSGAQKVFSFRKSKYLEIDNIGVSPKFRSKGIGAMLIGRVRGWVKERGYNRLFVSSYFHNLKGIEFYKRNGFAEIDLGLEMRI